MIQIDSDVPIPQRRRRYPLLDLAVGQSFFAAGISNDQIRGSISHAQRQSGRRFTVRTEDGGVRVWRTE